MFCDTYEISAIIIFVQTKLICYTGINIVPKFNCNLSLQKLRLTQFQPLEVQND